MRRLLQRVKSGRPEYGMSGVAAQKDTDASRLIIEAVDRADPRPVWLTLWGGATDLAQALWTVRATRSADAVASFVSKLRVYSISDQDDAGPWIRATFPSVFWIVSAHAFGQYRLATWTGISAREPGANPDDPDGNKLTYHWWQYREASGGVNPQQLAITGADSMQAQVVAPTAVKPAPNVDIPLDRVYHVVLSVTDDGSPALTSYRRVVLTIPAAGTPQGNGLGCRSEKTPESN